MAKRKRILVVSRDDEGVVGLLRRSGYEASSLTRPLEAVRRARALRPDLILLEYDLPRIQGPELTVLLKSDRLTRGIPILVVSTFSDPERLLIASLSGATGFLPRPVDAALLLKTVDTLIHRDVTAMT